MVQQCRRGIFGENGWEPAILALYYRTRDGEVFGIGNAAVIAAQGDRALAVTAAHVVQDLDRKAGERSSFRSLAAARAINPLFSSYITDAYGAREMDGVDDWVLVPHFVRPTERDFDVALAGVLRRDESPHQLDHDFGLKLVPPDRGETVVVVGSHSNMLVDSSEVTADAERHEFCAVALCAPARVITPVEEHRGLARGPIFEIDTEIPSGLSGSPVLWISEENRVYVCGVASSGTDGSGRGTVAAISPVLSLTMPVSESSGPDAPRKSVFELVHSGSISCYGSEIDLFEAVRNEDGTIELRRKPNRQR